LDWSADANPIVSSIHPIGISKKALHPNAARLFEDFLTSVEGQSLFTEEGFLSSHAGVRPRFPRMSLDRIKYPAPPDRKSASASKPGSPNINKPSVSRWLENDASIPLASIVIGFS
jgi:hypothetical protein